MERGKIIILKKYMIPNRALCAFAASRNMLVLPGRTAPYMIGLYDACGIACLLRGDRVSDGRLVTGLFRHATPHAFRVLDGPEWAKDILGPRNDAVEFHRLIIAADYPISLSSGGFCMQAI